MLVNVPAYGPDEVFGEAFPIPLREWRANVAQGRMFRNIEVDERGYPVHGHMVFATTDWWVARFEAAGVRRAPELERAIHAHYDTYFDAHSPARKPLYVFAKDGDAERVRALADRIRATPSRRARRSRGFGVVVIFVAALLVFGIACAIAAWFVDPRSGPAVGRAAAAGVRHGRGVRLGGRTRSRRRRRDAHARRRAPHPRPAARVLPAARASPATARAPIRPARSWWARPRRSTTSSGGPGETGEEYLPEQIYAVVETQLAYLREIGAVGAARPGTDPETGPD